MAGLSGCGSRTKRKAALSCQEINKSMYADLHKEILSCDESDTERKKTFPSKRLGLAKRQKKRAKKFKILERCLLIQNKCEENKSHAEEGIPSNINGCPTTAKDPNHAPSTDVKCSSQIPLFPNQKTGSRYLGKKISAKQKKISGKVASQKKNTCIAKPKKIRKVIKEEVTNNMEETPQSNVNFPNWKPVCTMWEQMKFDDYYEYLPPLGHSIYFKSQGVSDYDNVTPWKVLRCFGSCSSDGNSTSIVIFAGGAVGCCAWCPIPKGVRAVQYVALTTNSCWSYPSECAVQLIGLIQIWDFSSDKRPSLRLAIAHKWGKIWDLVWCPDGAWDNPEQPEAKDTTMPRLGLLAVACSDGFVRIYSVPHPQFVDRSFDSLPIYCPSPVTVLLGSYCLQLMCTSICWLKGDGCMKIAAGYSNGLIHVYHLHESTLTKIGESFLPIMTTRAHGTAVTSLAFAPNTGGRWLLSSGYDRMIYFWDTMGVGISFAFRRGIVCQLQWLPTQNGLVATLNSMNGRSTVFYIDHSSKIHVVISSQASTCMSTSISELKMLAHSDCLGKVIVSSVPTEINRYSVKRNRTTVFYTEMQEIGAQPFQKNKIVNETEPLKKKEPVSQYGMIYHDVFKKFRHGIIPEWEKDVLKSQDLRSIDCIQWNPNNGYHNWLFVGGHSGLCRIMYIRQI